MKRLSLLLAPLVVVGMLACEAQARKWRDNSGVFSVEAELVSYTKTTVKLRTAEGREIEIPLAKLSREDRQHLGGLGKAPRPQERPLEKILTQQRKDVEVADQPLRAVVPYLAELYDARLIIDRLSLDESGVALEAPITFKRRNVTLADALSDALDTVELGWTVRNNVVWIMTKEAIESNLDVRVYRSQANQNWDDVIHSIVKTVSPNSWDSVGGPAAHSVVPPHLVIAQTRGAHQQIEKLVAGRLKPVRGRSATLADIGLAELAKPLALDVPTSFIDRPLKDAAAFWAQASKADVLLDEPALRDAGLAPDMPVSINIKGLKLQDTIELTLRNLDLTWMPRRGAIVITTLEQAERELLVVRHKIVDAVGPNPASAGHLVVAVQTIIAPHTWDEVGGPASVRAGGGALEVRQTVHNHLAIAQMLNDLRAKGR